MLLQCGGLSGIPLVIHCAIQEDCCIALVQVHNCCRKTLTAHTSHTLHCHQVCTDLEGHSYPIVTAREFTACIHHHHTVYVLTVGPIRESQMSPASIKNWTLYFNLNDTLDFLAITSEGWCLSGLTCWGDTGLNTSINPLL
jgi:hypothetical protein